MSSGSVGSQLNINSKKLKLLVEELVSAVKESLDQCDDFIEVHNKYVAYTSLLLLNSCGHRPVKDPFCYRNDFEVVGGYVLIDDKVQIESRRYRLSILSAVSLKQLDHYTNHLKWLVSHLSKEKSSYNLAIKINKNIVDHVAKNKREVPHLFFLKREGKSTHIESVSKASLSYQLGSLWPFPFNFGRHYLSTYVRKKVCLGELEPELICLCEEQLGHFGDQGNPFGECGIYSPDVFNNLLRGFLDDGCESQGWVALSSKQPFNNLTDYGDLASCDDLNLSLGPERRKEDRLNAKKEDKKFLKNILEEFPVEELSKSPALLEAAKAFIINESIKSNAEDRIRLRLYKYYGYLGAKKKSYPSLKKFKRFHIQKIEKSPFNGNHFDLYRVAEATRNKFLQYLENCGRSGKTNNRLRCHAEVVVSAVLFDGVIGEKSISSLIAEIPEVIKEKDCIYCDIRDAKSRKQRSKFVYIERWVLQPLSALLLSRFPVDSQPIFRSTSNACAASELSCLLKELDVNIAEINAVKFLSLIGEAYWSMYLPPFIRNTVNGGIESPSLSESSLVRLLRSARIINGEIDKKDDKKIDMDFCFLPLKTKASISAGEFKKKLSQVIKISREYVPKGKALTNKERKQHLERNLNKLIGDSTDLPFLAVALLYWGKKLCNRGTDIFGKVKFSTVDKYLMLVCRNLVVPFYGHSFVHLDCSEYTNIYELVTESSKRKSRKQLVNNITDFHAYISRAGYAPEMSWGSAYRNSKDVGFVNNPSASFITISEYIEAINYLSKDEVKNTIGARYAHCCKLLLIFGFRYGLRIDEALHIKVSDIQFDLSGQSPILHVKNNVYRDTKSDAGRRQVPLLEIISNEERSVLSTLLKYKNIDCRIHELVFAQDEGYNQKLSYSNLPATINELLKNITGDYSVSFHTLRHSFATRLVTRSMVELGYLDLNDSLTSRVLGENNSSNLVKNLTGNRSRASKVFLAIANVLGHSTFKTTLQYYFHLAEFIRLSIAKSSDRWNNLIFSRADFIVSYAADIRWEALARRRQRKGIDSNDLVRTLNIALGDREFQSTGLKTSKKTPTNILGNRKPKNNLTLSDLDAMITMFGNPEVSISYLADVFLLPTGVISQIKEAYERLSRETGCDSYNLSASGSMQTAFTKESNSVRHFLYGINEKAHVSRKLYSELIKGSLVWRDCYHNNAKFRPIVIANSKALINYINFVGFFEVYPKHLNAYVPDEGCKWFESHSKSGIVSLGNGSARLSVKFNSVKYNCSGIPLHPRHERDSRNRVAISLGKTSSHPLHYQTRLDRVCFLLSLYLLIQPIETPEKGRVLETFLSD